MITINKCDLAVQVLNKDYLSEIHAIEQLVHITPWSFNKLQSCFSNERITIYGCLCKSQLIGYGVLQIIEPEAELQNFAINLNFQGQGIGSYFLTLLIRHCQNLGLAKIMLEVRESNISAIQLYQAKGFQQLGRRTDYYQLNSGKESALLMTKML